MACLDCQFCLRSLHLTECSGFRGVDFAAVNTFLGQIRRSPTSCELKQSSSCYVSLVLGDMGGSSTNHIAGVDVCP